MRTLVTIEIEHGEDTDEVQEFAENLIEDNRFAYPGLVFTDYAVRVDTDKPL